MFSKLTGVFFCKISSTFPVIVSRIKSSSILPLCISSFRIMASLKTLVTGKGGHCVDDVKRCGL